MPVTHGVTSSSLVRTANIFSDKVFDNFGALVQLVRIHACHAWGHEFESRTHRLQRDDFLGNHLFVCGMLGMSIV